MKIGHVLLSRRATTVVALDRVHVRVGAVTTRSLLTGGYAHLLVAIGSTPGGRAATAESIATNTKALSAVLDFQEAMLRAGVEAGSTDAGATWEPIQLVDPDQQDADAGRLPSSVFTPAEQAQLLKAIVALSGVKGAEADAVARFPNPGA